MAATHSIHGATCCRNSSIPMSWEVSSYWRSVVPCLDRTVVEYVQRLGAHLKVRHGTRKWLHRQACQRYLPARILRRRKRGFAANVVDAWFQSSVNGELRELLMDDDSLMFRLLKPERVRQLLQSH